MAQQNIRRIAVKPRSYTNDKWDDEWVRPVWQRGKKIVGYTRKRVYASSSRLAYWAGLAGILGGISWGGMFLFFQAEELRFEYYFYSLAFWPSTRILVVPMLLFSLCLVGLYVLQEDRRMRGAGLRRLGFVLASLGLISTMSSTLDEYWLDRLLGIPSYGIIDYIYSGSLFHWDRVADLFLMGFGLALFSIAAIKAKAWPTWVLVAFVLTSLAIFLVPIGLRFFISGYEMYDFLFGGGVFVGVMLLFGASWVTLGYALLRSRKTQLAQG